MIFYVAIEEGGYPVPTPFGEVLAYPRSGFFVDFTSGGSFAYAAEDPLGEKVEFPRMGATAEFSGGAWAITEFCLRAEDGTASMDEGVLAPAEQALIPLLAAWMGRNLAALHEAEKGAREGLENRNAAEVARMESALETFKRQVAAQANAPWPSHLGRADVALKDSALAL